MGRFEINFEGLCPHPKHYRNPHGVEKPVFPAPEGFRGIMFYMMEKMRTGTAQPVLVMVENIVLDTPVPIDYERHTGYEKRVGPRGKVFTTEYAHTLLDDSIKINPGLQTALIAIKMSRSGE